MSALPYSPKMVADCTVVVVKKHHLPAHISQEAFGFGIARAVYLGMCSQHEDV